MAVPEAAPGVAELGGEELRGGDISGRDDANSRTEVIIEQQLERLGRASLGVGA